MLLEVLEVRVRLVEAADVLHQVPASFVDVVLFLFLTACEANGA